MTSTTPSFLPLSQTSVHPKYLARCRRAGIFSLAQMIRIPPRELANQLKLGNEETEKILDSLIGGMVPKVMCLGGNGGGGQTLGLTHTYGSEDTGAEASCSDSMVPTKSNPASSSKLSTGTPSLDVMLGGGFNVGQLTELVGESSTGKSQLICQLAVSTALGLGGIEPGSVALMTSEGDAQGSTFVNRMVQIVKSRKRMTFPRSSSDQAEDDEASVEVKQLLRNVHIASIRDLDALDHVLEYTLPGLAHRLLEGQRDAAMDPSSSSAASSSLGPRPPLRLVILDNLPSLFYAAQPTTGNKNLMFSRGMSLNGIADSLKRIARIGSGLDLSPPPPKSEVKGDADATIKLEALAESKVEDDVIDRTPRQEDWPRLPQDPQLPVSGGSAVVVINHVSDAFERDLQSMRDIALTSSNSSRRGPTTQSGEPPLAYAEQAPYISGLLDSFSSATSLPEASSSDDGGAKPAASHGAFATRGMSMLLQEMDPLEGGNSGAKQAALGHVWNNCINARVMLCKTGRRVRREAIDDEGGPRDTQRSTESTVLRDLGLPLMRASLVFSPDSAPSSSLEDVRPCYYVLTSSGLCGLSIEVVQRTLLPRSHDRDEPEEEENKSDIKMEQPSKRWKKEESFGDSAMQGVLGGQDLEAIMGAFESA